MTSLESICYALLKIYDIVMVVWTLIIRQNMAVKRVLARSLSCVCLCYFLEQNTQTSVLFSVTFTICFHVSWQVTLCCGLVKRYLEDVRHCDLTLQSALVSTRLATSTGSSPDKSHRLPSLPAVSSTFCLLSVCVFTQAVSHVFVFVHVCLLGLKHSHYPGNPKHSC